MNNTARFISRYVVDPSGCWIWNKVNESGYGFFRMNGKTYTAHAASWELLVGAVPEGHVVDHLCRNRPCVNPSHLQPVTQKVNVRRGRGHGSEDNCPKGHLYDEENTRVYRDMRYCRACDRERKRLARSAA